MTKEVLAAAGFPDAVRSHVIDVTTEAGEHRLWFVWPTVGGYTVEYFNGKPLMMAPAFSPRVEEAVATLTSLWQKYTNEGAALRSARSLVANAENIGSLGQGPVSVLGRDVVPSEGVAAVRMIDAGERKYLFVAALVELD